MNAKTLLLFACCSFPPTYLTVLLLFDVKYYDAEQMTYAVPIYPFPVYLKVVLGVITCCIVGVLEFLAIRSRLDQCNPTQGLEMSKK